MSERHLTRTAVFVILERGNKIFLLRRADTGWADGLLTVPAGHVNKGDSVRESAVKEAREEAGVEVAPEDLEFIHADYIKDEYTNFYFRATRWSGEPFVAEPHLASEALWAEKDELPGDLIPQLKRIFKEMADGSYFSEADE